jgi:hypothetical protein
LQTSPENAPPALFSGFVLEGLEEAFAVACSKLELQPIDMPVRPWTRKSLGASVESVDGTQSWLKISGIPIGTSNRQRRKEEISACIKGVPKPSIFASFDWIERDVCWRALQMEHAPSPASSPSAFPARHLPSISDAWIHGLRQALADLAKVEATHFFVTAVDFSNEIRLRFGNDAPHQAVELCTAHGDLHWANLTAPTLSILDWENWGRAPRGYDVANLIASTAYDPVLMQRLESAFADELEAPSGRVAQLSVCANMLNFVDAYLCDPIYRLRIEELARRALNCDG